MYDVQEILAVLQIDKNTLGEVAFISMSKLHFVLFVVCAEEIYQRELYQLLSKALSIGDKIIKVYANDKEEYLKKYQEYDLTVFYDCTGNLRLFT